MQVKIHIVKKGDTLYDLAQKYHVSLEKLIEMNPQIADPNKIDVGMKVKIPSSPVIVAPPEGSYAYKHVVKQGDTLWKLAKAAGVSLEAIIAANPHLKNPNVLLTGEVVYIPKPGAKGLNMPANPEAAAKLGGKKSTAPIEKHAVEEIAVEEQKPEKAETAESESIKFPEKPEAAEVAEKPFPPEKAAVEESFEKAGAAEKVEAEKVAAEKTEYPGLMKPMMTEEAEKMANPYTSPFTLPMMESQPTEHPFAQQPVPPIMAGEHYPEIPSWPMDWGSFPGEAGGAKKDADMPAYPGISPATDYPNVPNYPNQPDYPNYPNYPNFPSYPTFSESAAHGGNIPNPAVNPAEAATKKDAAFAPYAGASPMAESLPPYPGAGPMDYPFYPESAMVSPFDANVHAAAHEAMFGPMYGSPMYGPMPNTPIQPYAAPNVAWSMNVPPYVAGHHVAPSTGGCGCGCGSSLPYSLAHAACAAEYGPPLAEMCVPVEYASPAYTMPAYMMPAYMIPGHMPWGAAEYPIAGANAMIPGFSYPYASAYGGHPSDCGCGGGRAETDQPSTGEIATVHVERQEERQEPQSDSRKAAQVRKKKKSGSVAEISAVSRRRKTVSKPAFRPNRPWINV